MRGLTRASPSRTTLITGGAIVGFAAVGGLVLAGCGAGDGGVRKEGRARTGWVSPSPGRAGDFSAPTVPSPTPTGQKVDPIALIKDDPMVGPGVKAKLKPCTAAAKRSTTPSPQSQGYPVDVAYGRLTGGGTWDVIVNIMTCADGLGVGSYVYRKEGDTYRNVFTDEEPPVHADVSKRNELQLTKPVFASGDAVCCPSGANVITYRWSPKGGAFAVVGRQYTDYSDGDNSAVGDSDNGTVQDENRR